MGLRILWTGATPWTRSGYGKPGFYLFPRLHEAGHANALAAFYGYQGATTVTQVQGTPLRLFGMARERFFNDIIEYHAQSFEADVVISFQDVWILERWGTPRGFTWCPRVPVDTHPVSKEVLKAIEGCHTPLGLCEWGTREMAEHGFPQARCIPCGVDLDVCRPMDQGAARAAAGLPQDGFIVGMVAANSSYPSRKSFPEVIQAWRRWLAGGGQGLLYLHTTLSPKRQDGLDFEDLFATLNTDGGYALEWTTLDDPDPARKARAQVMFACQHKLWCQAYDDQALTLLYNSMNGLLSPSQAEGFGIPIVEAQACGVPVITMQVSSMPELTFAGQCIVPEQMAWERQGGWRAVAPVGRLAESIQWLWEMSQGEKARTYLAERARAGAERYGFDRVVEEHWLPFLAELEGELK